MSWNESKRQSAHTVPDAKGRSYCFQWKIKNSNNNNKDLLNLRGCVRLGENKLT